MADRATDHMAQTDQAEHDTMPLRQRRSRDPAATREAILQAAGRLLAMDGPEGVSLSEVAHIARVNRGTAYQHFETREKLVAATAQWLSDKLFRAVFGDPETIGERRVEDVDVAELTRRVAEFAMNNAELCRGWLMQLLVSPEPSGDMFWHEYEGSIRRFAATELAEPDIDSEVFSVLMLAGTFLWPLWARAHAETDAGRSELAGRFARECLRLAMFGTMRVEHFSDLAASLGRPLASPPR